LKLLFSTIATINTIAKLFQILLQTLFKILLHKLFQILLQKTIANINTNTIVNNWKYYFYFFLLYEKLQLHTQIDTINNIASTIAKN